MVCRGGRAVCGIGVRAIWQVLTDLKLGPGQGHWVTLVGSWRARALYRGLLDAGGLFPDARGVEFARMTFG